MDAQCEEGDLPKLPWARHRRTEKGVALRSSSRATGVREFRSSHGRKSNEVGGGRKSSVPDHGRSRLHEALPFYPVAVSSSDAFV